MQADAKTPRGFEEEIVDSSIREGSDELGLIAVLLVTI
jgi:hypothetical protein